MDGSILSERFQAYLLTGERVLWAGQPKQGVLFGAMDILLIPFSMMWGGFAIFWNAMVWFAPFTDGSGDGPGWFFKLWGLPFLVIGLYMIGGRFLHDAHLRKALFYAVTDQRILILRGSKLVSLDVHRVPRLELSEYGDATGTLAFEAASGFPWGGMNGMAWWVPTLGNASRFFRIQEPRRVFELIRDQGRAR